ncbi:MAG TPA: PD-(D/E)XK nuclease family protein [Candidatus Saccharimonadales bacterium]|nr:PD-(D/E)XK nuclease family protein [Candidatus Saccharimonadales bacterium]
MIVSITERPEYKRCRRKWNLGSRNRENLTPIIPATALSLGTYVHAALAAWMQDQSKPAKHYFLQTASIARAQAIKTYYQQVGAVISDSEVNRIDDAIVMGAFMCENYEKHWTAPLPPDFTVVTQEQRVLVPIPNTEHTEEWIYDRLKKEAVLVKYDTPRLHYVSGKFDGVIEDSRGRLYVLERKTYNQRPREEVLRSNDQFLGYTWMLKQLGLPGRVAGVAYDGLWKRDHVPTKVDGRNGKLSDLFIRMRIERPPEELAEFEQELAWEVMEMASNPHITKHRTSDGSCFWGCDYEKLCAAMSRGEDVDYVIKSRFVLRPDENQDSDSDSDAA